MSIVNSPLITADRASRLLTALLALLLAGAPVAAQTITPQIGGGLGFTFDGGISGKGAPVGPQPTGDILLVDNTSFILQVDGASLICRAGGC